MVIKDYVGLTVLTRYLHYRGACCLAVLKLSVSSSPPQLSASSPLFSLKGKNNNDEIKLFLLYYCQVLKSYIQSSILISLLKLFYLKLSVFSTKHTKVATVQFVTCVGANVYLCMPDQSQ